jgi:hypothetical protein
MVTLRPCLREGTPAAATTSVTLWLLLLCSDDDSIPDVYMLEDCPDHNGVVAAEEVDEDNVKVDDDVVVVVLDRNLILRFVIPLLIIISLVFCI